MTELSGEYSLGLSTIVHPAANAGATLIITWFTGQFHGVIMPTIPTGSSTKVEPPRAEGLSNV